MGEIIQRFEYSCSHAAVIFRGEGHRVYPQSVGCSIPRAMDFNKYQSS
jgi:hypothetical protein